MHAYFRSWFSSIRLNINLLYKSSAFCGCVQKLIILIKHALKSYVGPMDRMKHFMINCWSKTLTICFCNKEGFFCCKLRFNNNVFILGFEIRIYFSKF